MKRINKILAYVLSFVLVISTLYVSTTKKTMAASGTYLIKVTNTDTYLYANGGNVAAGGLNSGDTRYYWILTIKDDGTYWIQNQNTGGYMAIENQTGKVELLTTIYDVWASSKWTLSTDYSSVIQNSWLGSAANINISGAEAVYNSGTTSFTFESTSGSTGDGGSSSTGGSADSATIPGANDDVNSIGASMPYTRYDSKQATLGGGAVIAESATYEKSNIASQASEQSYVRLPYSGAYAEWTMSTTGNGVTMRFTMPDSSDGMGCYGSIDVYVNGTKIKTVDLNSYYMWQYFDAPNPSVNPTGSPYDYPITNGTAAFAFDEVHFRLDSSLKAGDKIRIQSTGAGGLEYGVDFLEIEETGSKLEKPAGAYSVTDFGAVANDGVSDYSAIVNCINAANSAGADVYFPEGTFNIDQIWYLSASNMKVTGAGIWYTNIQFTNSNKGSGGISGSKAYNVEFCNMYINSNLRSRYGQEAVYKCFMDVWSGGSYIHDIWEEHFECGFWLADYNFGDGTDYSDGVKITNSRIRNNFADGVNFCQGTSNATVYNCSIRNNGDDGLAMWNNNYNVKDESYNTFCYNTIDFIWRAGGIAIYGGNGHKVYNNYISDMFMASGIHVNTNFDGYKFTNNSDGIVFSNNILVRSGTTSDSWHSDMAAVDITEPNGTIRNLTFNNTYIYDSQHDAVRVTGNPSNVVFNNLKVYGTGKDGKTTSGNDNGAAIKFADINSSPSIRLNGFTYANIAYTGIIYGSRGNCSISNESNLGSGYSYTIPSGAQSSGGASTETPTEAPTEAPTETPTTQKETTTPDSTDIDYSSLKYTAITCSGADELTLYYSIYSSSVDGIVPWYGDGGNTLSLQFSAASGNVTSVSVNGTEPISGVVTEKALGLVKINPTLLEADSYSAIKVTTESGEFVIVVKTNKSIEKETTVEDATTEKVTEEATTEEITTEKVTEEPTTEEELTTEQEEYNPVSNKVQIEGFQISVAKKGIRTITSVESEIYGKEVVGYGNIYGIVMDGYSSDDMWIGNDSPYVKQFEATSEAVASVKYSDSETTVDYVMTMVNNGFSSVAYSQRYAVRGYAMLSDGSYVYSEICEYSIFDVASVLYDNLKMNTYEAHQYLYTDILAVVKPEYVVVDYSWGNIIVKA